MKTKPTDTSHGHYPRPPPLPDLPDEAFMAVYDDRIFPRPDLKEIIAGPVKWLVADKNAGWRALFIIFVVITLFSLIVLLDIVGLKGLIVIVAPWVKWVILAAGIWLVSGFWIGVIFDLRGRKQKRIDPDADVLPGGAGGVLACMGCAPLMWGWLLVQSMKPVVRFGVRQIKNLGSLYDRFMDRLADDPTIFPKLSDPADRDKPQG